MKICFKITRLFISFSNPFQFSFSYKYISIFSISISIGYHKNFMIKKISNISIFTSIRTKYRSHNPLDVIVLYQKILFFWINYSSLSNSCTQARIKTKIKFYSDLNCHLITKKFIFVNSWHIFLTSINFIQNSLHSFY